MNMLGDGLLIVKQKIGITNMPYTPYGGLADSKEEKTDKNENNYDLL